MDKRTNLKIIQKEITEIANLIERNMASESLRKIDKDLILEKLRNLYDNVFQLDLKLVEKEEKVVGDFHGEIPSIIDDVLEKRDNVDSKVQKVIDEMREEEKEEESQSKSKVVIVKSKTDSEDIEQIELEPEKLANKKAEKEQVVEAPEIVSEIREENLEENIVHRTYNHDEVKTIADQFQNDVKPTLNEILQNKQKARDLASQYSDKPITNLKASVSINDKIWYIKELFSGDTDLYNDTLKILNEKRDLDDALSYLDRNFKWDQQKDSFQSFLELLFRRFLPNETQL
jgi:predicted RND superfamily exporter protein